MPVGVDIVAVASMPKAVQRSVNQFVRSLAEAVVIVLAVSLISLGLRTGLVVAVSIPLVLAMTFAAMHYFDIGLHKISLGALILALGLLVDDAIIAVEMMVVKMEQGWDRARAATFAWTSTAFPMLTGTMVTVAGFSAATGGASACARRRSGPATGRACPGRCSIGSTCASMSSAPRWGSCSTRAWPSC